MGSALAREVREADRGEPELDAAAPGAADPVDDGDGNVARGPTVHRLRDLDRRQRLWAGGFTTGVLLAPLLALGHYLPNWVAAGDPALMGLRALDVGTGRTPLVGQPSSSTAYVAGKVVNHIGPSHFYLLAPFVRLFGPDAGMLLVSILITAGSILVAAWAMFRQLGPRGGAVAAVVLGAVTFTTGAASLANPVSSNIAGYPLLASAVLLWCVACGDARLLPLATLWVSFTAQQHLAVLPAVVAFTGVAAVAWLVAERRQLRRWARPGLVAGGVAAVLWAPVLAQQAFGRHGNLGELVWFLRHSDQPKVGARTAVKELVRTLGLPPLLGQLHLTGDWFFGDVSLLTGLTAAVVVGLLVLAARRWRAAGDRRRTTLLVMTGGVALGGVLNGSSVPLGIEQNRLPFYHWAFVVAFFVTVALLLLAGDALASLGRAGRLPSFPGRALALPIAGLVVLVLPAVANPGLTRESSSLFTAYSPTDRSTMDALVAAVRAERDHLEGPVLLVSIGDGWNSGLREALALDLADTGIDIVHPTTATDFVHDEHLAHRSSVRAGLVLVAEAGGQEDIAAQAKVPGKLLVDVDDRPTFDKKDYDALVAQARAARSVRLTPKALRAVKAIDNTAGQAMALFQLGQLSGDTAATYLRDRGVLENLLAMPLAEPAFDPARIRRVLASLPDNDPWLHELQWRLRVYLLDREQVRAWAALSMYP